jgi:hypothetical protein
MTNLFGGARTINCHASTCFGYVLCFEYQSSPPDSSSGVSAQGWALRQIAQRGEPYGGGRTVEII